MAFHNKPSNRHIGPRQAHMNSRKFVPDLYSAGEAVDPKWVRVMGSLCCARCNSILQWKVQYGKFTPLEKPRRCNICGEKTVVMAFHHICQGCAEKNALCAKCQKNPVDEWAKHIASLPVAKGEAPQCEEPEEEKGERRATAGEDDDEIEGEWKAPAADSDPEFAPLRGLDVTQIKRMKKMRLSKETTADLNMLRERERRTAKRMLAKSRQHKEEQSDEADSDDAEEVI